MYLRVVGGGRVEFESSVGPTLAVEETLPRLVGGNQDRLPEWFTRLEGRL